LNVSRKKGPVIVTRRGQPVAIVKAITKDQVNIGSLWESIRRAAERAGYGPEDVEKLIQKSRAGK